jgi:hypothetical protein
MKKIAFFKQILGSKSLPKRLQRVTPQEVMWLCEAAWNVSRGRVPLSSKEYKALLRHRNNLKRLAKCRNVREGRGQLVQYGGAFLPILIPAIISALAALAK